MLTYDMYNIEVLFNRVTFSIHLIYSNFLPKKMEIYHVHNRPGFVTSIS